MDKLGLPSAASRTTRARCTFRYGSVRDAAHVSRVFRSSGFNVTTAALHAMAQHTTPCHVCVHTRRTRH